METYFLTILALIIGAVYMTDAFVDALIARIEGLSERVKRLEARLENGSGPAKESDQQQPTNQT
jgi:hypothetical protein